MKNLNELRDLVHNEIKSKGYWFGKRAEGEVLMLIQTEVTKLHDPDKLNKGEKLADIFNRVLDYCGKHKVDLSEELPKVHKCSLFDMSYCLTCEIECYRASLDRFRYTNIKKLLSMCLLYAKDNNIDLNFEWERKFKILKQLKKEKRI